MKIQLFLIVMLCVLMITEEVLGVDCQYQIDNLGKKGEGEACTHSSQCCNADDKVLECLGVPGLEICKKVIYG